VAIGGLPGFVDVQYMWVPIETCYRLALTVETPAGVIVERAP